MLIKITIDEQELRKELLSSLVPEINLYIVKATNRIKPKLKTIIKDALEDSDVINSLNGGQLQAEIGMIDPAARTAAIINQWANSIDVNFSPAKISGSRITGNIIISAIRSDYNDVLSMSESFINTSNGGFLDWLEWLLLNGDKKIILDYKIGFDLHNVSRTGLGKIMIEKRGASWGIPPQFSGVSNDNFVTRAIDKFSNKIAQLIEDEFTK